MLALIGGLVSAQANSSADSSPNAHQAPKACDAAKAGVPLKVMAVTPEKATMGEKITIEVKCLSEAIDQGKDKFEPTKLILYFDGYPLKEGSPCEGRASQAMKCRTS